MRKKPTKQPTVPDELIDALEAVLARLWEHAFHASQSDSGPDDPDREDHIFFKLEIIRHWLDYVEEDCGRG